MIHEGSGSGIVGGVAFPEINFVITAFGDTDNRGNRASGLFGIHHDTAEIAIDGVETFDFLTATLTFVNQDRQIVGFSVSMISQTQSGFDLFDGPTDIAFATWDMRTSIGPIEGIGRLIQWNFKPVETSGGTLFFSEDHTIITKFTATVVCEPATLAIAAAPLLAVGFFRRCR